MPFAIRDGVRLHWRSDGRPGAPALLLGNSLGTDLALWDPVIPPLARRFRVIRFDARGHGASDAPGGDYTIDDLGRDAIAVAEAAGARRFAWAGISMGGMIGIWLGAHAGERLERLVLAGTAAKLPAEIWTERIAKVRAGGLDAIVDGVLQRWYTPRRLKRSDEVVATVRSTFVSTPVDGYLGCCAAIRDMDLRGALGAIRTPTLVVTGTHDRSTPKELGEAIAAAIPGATVRELPVAHVPLELPGVFADALFAFLHRPPASDDRGRYKAGLERRKEALGREYVEQRLQQVQPFNADYQDLITRYTWGELWSRNVIDDRTRRLVILAMMLALARWEEFDMHVKSGLAAELAPYELQELLLLAAIYCGIPVANIGFQHAAELLRATEQGG